MSTHSKVDPSTLGWVKNEIDETLKQARLALESFAENPTDKTRLRFCVTHLHQVVGTLLMVELDGAAMLAKETEALAQDVVDEKVAVDNRIFDALTRAILTLPDYLARLQIGQPDTPLKHLALMNELRAAHQVPPISELELFSPDLSVRPPVGASSRKKPGEADFVEMAKQVRGAFQPALLNWLRDNANKQPLHTIAGIFDELQAQAGMAVFEQLCWVAGGFIEALADDGLEVTAERKKLFARLDQQIKKVIDGAEKSLVRTSSEALTRALLWEVAQTESTGPRVTQIKRAFDLEFLLAGGDTDEADKDGMPTPEALQSVSAALGKEIETAQDMMTAYYDPEQKNSVSLEPLIESFRKMSGTLDMLGVLPMKAMVDELSEVCRAILENRIANPEAVSMSMAEALLLMESSTRDISRSPAEWKKQIEEATYRLHALHSPEDGMPHTGGIEVSDAELSESDFRQLVSVVAGEVGINLAKIEEALEGFAADTARLSLLDETPSLLSQILGAMQILGQARAADLVEETKHYIQEIHEGRLGADSAIMDGLAVCIGTIGAYVEGLRAGRQNLESLVEAALHEMRLAAGGGHGQQPDPTLLIEHLRSSLEAWIENTESQESLDAMQQQLGQLTRLAQEQGQEKIEEISAEMNHLLRLVAQDPMQLSPVIVETLKQSFTAMSVLAGRRMAVRTSSPAPEVSIAPVEVEAVKEETPVVTPNREPSPPPVAAPPAATTREKPKNAEEQAFDEEIMQIFVEDAREVLENIKVKFVSWREDTDNQNDLTELRRGYHTIKGSGRMVGASEIAELSWAVENMLNKVRDGKAALSPAMMELLQQAQDVMPAMVDTLAGGPAHGIDTESLRERANDLAQSNAAPVAALPTVATKAVAPPVQDLPKLDGTLLEIFTNEARGNLANIRQEIAACRKSGGVSLVSDGFFRSTHTLQGNARSLGLQVMSETCAEMERLLHALKTQNLPLGETPLSLASRFEVAVAGLVDLLNSGASSSGELRQKFAELAHDIRAENVHVVQPESATETQASPVEDSTVGVEEEIEAAPPVEESVLVMAAPKSAPRTTKQPVEVASVAAAPEEANTEQIDPELLEIFQEEAGDILNTIEESLTRWRGRPDDRSAVQELKRVLHTLKGGARMAGAMSMGNLSHNTETLLRNVEDGTLSAAAELFDLLDEAHDMLVTMLNHAQSGKPVPSTQHLNARLVALASGQPLSTAPVPVAAPKLASVVALPTKATVKPEAVAPTGKEAPSAVAPVVAASMMEALVEQAEEGPDERRDVPEVEEEKQWPEKMERRGQVRVNTNLLNDLVNYAGEVSISRSRMEQQIYSFRDNMGELSRNIVRFREQIRELEIQSESQILYRTEQDSADGAADFDPLEFDRFSRLQQLSRSLAESLHDLGTIQNSLGIFVGEAESVLQQQARINTELQEGLMRTRMVSISTQAARLRHIVRSTAREVGKRVELHLEGAEVEVDRNVLDRMIGPFEHMIRNSIDHGIEPEAERKKKGKPTLGRISIVSAQQGSEVVIRFADDGAGLNIEAIRRKAVERGLIPADAALSEEELIQFILMSGFSTAEQVTQLSGRGVGMDVVHNEVKQLGGSMSVDSERGVGTTFIIRLPLTLSIAQALMIYVGEQMFAIPLASVVNIIEFPVDKLHSMAVGKNPLLNHLDQVYPYMHLGSRFGIYSQPRNERKVPVLIARTGTREVAIQIDGLGGTREVVIKALGPQLSEIKGIAGATILGDGRVILILDVPGLWYRDDVIHFEHRAAAKPVAEVRERPLIMVVDDSLTVRKITSRHLQKSGMDVMVAKDGMDAVEQLRDRIPDVMLVDIEMPRMDGYELTTRVRSDATLKHIPIIMITSRAGTKHRDKAFDLGVDMYMSKPYQEDDLFKNIDTLLTKGRGS
jgi:chemosensory pili system protein ChpA (sensor histidine kinase/response regulator)